MSNYDISRPSTLYRADKLERARENLKRHDWAKQVVENLRASVSLVMARDGDYVRQMISEITPGGTGFTNCPACEGNTIHGAYDWDAADPEILRCTTCGLAYPNNKYPEDVAFVAAQHGNGQTITYHGGYSFDFRGFHLYSSWTGQIRARKVAFMAGQALALAKIYALTSERAYGQKACDILVRFATVYPNYLVHSSYGEWIDLPPHLVARQINDLPEDEWTIAPNKPDRKLHSGYWNSGRATGLGMEGTFVRQVAVAYDLVWDLLTVAQRDLVEQDLLRESTIMMLADPALNNKSVSNLTASGLVGMAIGDPKLVRAGAKGFWHFIHEWFLADGTTSESPAYGLMTLNGLRDFGEALHEYSDPAGYEDEDRLDDLDVYGDVKCRAVFRALYDTLLPSLVYPAWADSYVTTTLDTAYLELMVARYQLPEYRALLGELLDDVPSKTGDETALWVRDPHLEIKKSDAVVLQDVFYPALRMGFLRTGQNGLAGTAILDASHWGVHHHRDSLNLTLFAHGHELLTDLGYLWDRPDKDMTVRTPAHNLVVVDEAEQRAQERLGSLHFYDTTSRVKVIDCSSHAYAQCDVYRRMCIWIDHGEMGGYWVDIFDVEGGTVHDALYHGPLPDFEVDGITLLPGENGPYGIKDVVEGEADAPWCMTWEMGDGVAFSAWAVPIGEEHVKVGSGWGERGWGHFNAPDKKGDVPYVIRRREGEPAQSRFVSVYDAYKEDAFVKSIAQLDTNAFAVTTALGCDVIALGKTQLTTSLGDLSSDGELVVASDTFLYLKGGRQAQVGAQCAKLDVANTNGKIISVSELGAYFECDQTIDVDWVGKTVLVGEGASTTGYRIYAVEGARIYTRDDNGGFDFGGGETWQIIPSILKEIV